MSTQKQPLEASLTEIATKHSEEFEGIRTFCKAIKSNTRIWLDVRKCIKLNYAGMPVGVMFEIPSRSIFEKCNQCVSLFIGEIESLLYKSGLLITPVTIQESCTVCFTSAYEIIHLCHNFFTDPPRPSCRSLTCRTAKVIHKKRLVAIVTFQFARISLRVRFLTSKEIRR